MKPIFGYTAGILLAVICVACSTEKDTLINRGYHNMTAHYNGYFNANLLIDDGLEIYRNKAVEDFHLILSLDQYPEATDVPGMLAAIDTAITKCTRVIVKHSMPSMANVTIKSEEHCRWIDDNWFVIGYANFLKRDYPQAIEKLTYVAESYNGQRSVHIARIFLARSYVAMDDYRAAAATLKLVKESIDLAESEKEGDGDGKSDKKPSKFQKKKQKEQEAEAKKEAPAVFPDKWIVDYQVAMAEMYIAQSDYKKAIEHLQEAIPACKNKKRSARYMFVLAQLLSRTGDNQQAAMYFAKVVKSPSPYVMQFQASINKSLCASSGDASVIGDLNKLLRDPKNTEYRDQIYYALGEITLRSGDRTKAKEYYSASALWSVKNNRQKGQSYLRLGDICFDEKNYVHAQKYYDSCVTALPKDFEGLEAIEAKAEGLTDLVFHYELVILEDSVQRIGKMSEKEQEKYLADLLKKMKEDEKKRKADEQARLQAMQTRVNNLDATSGSGSKWYFYNGKIKAAGFNDFRALWGQRPVEDDWRRSNKLSHAIITDGNGSTGDSVQTTIPVDSLTIDDLRKNLPKSDEDFASSNERLLNSLYMLGIIYKEQLKEIDEATAYFTKVVDKKIEHPRVLPSLFQLYLLGREKGVGESYKDVILTTYPDSEIAMILKDPDYLRRKEEKEKVDLNKYADTYEKYRFNKFQEVQTICEDVIANDTANQFIRKYYLLSAYCLSHLQNGKTEVISRPLVELIAKAPASEEADQARKFLGQLGENSFNPGNDLAPNYVIDNNSPHFFVVVITGDDPATIQKTKLSDFNSTFFSNNNLDIVNQMMGAGKQLLRVKSFDNAVDGISYMTAYRSNEAKAVIGSMADDYDCFLINIANFKEMTAKNDHIAYMDFFKQNYILN